MRLVHACNAVLLIYNLRRTTLARSTLVNDFTQLMIDEFHKKYHLVYLSVQLNLISESLSFSGSASAETSGTIVSHEEEILIHNCVMWCCCFCVLKKNKTRK